MLERYNHDIIIAIEAILANKMRSLLTALGIIFGVAAVISMLAIGNGAQQEIMEQIEQVGVNNIIVKPVLLQNAQSGDQAEVDEFNGFSTGLTLDDANAIRELLPSIKQISPVISMDYTSSRSGQSMRVKVEGVSDHYFGLFNLPLTDGHVFSKAQQEKGLSVCIIGENVRARMFKDAHPVGEMLKVGNNWMKVIGVIEPRDFTTSANDEMGISSSDNKIFVPEKTMLIRFINRAKLDFEALARSDNSGDSNGGNTNNINQLDKIVVQVKATEQLSSSAELIRLILLRRHKGNLDFEVTVPELLLKQQQQTNRIFNIVLGAIAGISLLVGGIGIMNIMLASVLERIQEIGTRQAIGATRMDIVVQFLSEATLISVIGGLIGVTLGILLAQLITVFADIKTIITPFSVLIAFVVSSSVGIVFGFFPAQRASQQDPVESLRH